jgi:Flp pilus assembly protein TadD
VTLNNLGLACGNAGRHRSARAAIEQALHRIDAVLPGDRPDNAWVLTNLGEPGCELAALP